MATSKKENVAYLFFRNIRSRTPKSSLEEIVGDNVISLDPLSMHIISKFLPELGDTRYCQEPNCSNLLYNTSPYYFCRDCGEELDAQIAYFDSPCPVCKKTLEDCECNCSSAKF